MQRIEELIDAALAAGLGSAIAVSVGDGGREVYAAHRGHTRRVPDLGAPIDEHTRFDIASLTKPMVTAACAMVLVRHGRLALAAPVRDHVPEAATTGTVRDLLGHAAGCLPHVEFFRAMQAGSRDPRAELVERAAREPASAPGITAVYSDLGYILLGEVIARAAGLPLEQAFAELVGGPLGLDARYVASTEPALTEPAVVATELDVPGAATTHSVLPSDARAGATHRGLVVGRAHDENAYFGGGVCGHAGLFATLGDVARFAAAVVTGSGPFDAAIVETCATTAAAPGTSWRLGWDTPSATPGSSHAGDRWPRSGVIGHLGFTGTSLWLDLPRRRWVALLTNRVHPTRLAGSADAIKALRRAVHDAAVSALADR